MEHQKRNFHSTVQRREINPSFTLSHLDYFIGFLNIGQKSAETEEQSKSTQPTTGQKLPQKLQEIPGDTQREKSLNWSHIEIQSTYMVRELNYPNGTSCPDKND